MYLPRATESEKGGSKGGVRRGATAKGVMEKSRYAGSLRGRRSKEMTQLNTSFPRGSKGILSPRGGGSN